jgi:hypothetical protein
MKSPSPTEKLSEAKSVGEIQGEGKNKREEGKRKQKIAPHLSPLPRGERKWVG